MPPSGARRSTSGARDGAQPGQLMCASPRRARRQNGAPSGARNSCTSVNLLAKHSCPALDARPRRAGARAPARGKRVRGKGQGTRLKPVRVSGSPVLFAFTFTLTPSPFPFSSSASVLILSALSLKNKHFNKLTGGRAARSMMKKFLTLILRPCARHVTANLIVRNPRRRRGCRENFRREDAPCLFDAEWEYTMEQNPNGPLCSATGAGTTAGRR